MPVLLRGQVNLKERTRMGFSAKPINKPLTKKQIAIEKEKIMGKVLGVSYQRKNTTAKKNYLKILDDVIKRNPRLFNKRMNEFEKYYIAQQRLEVEKYENRMFLKYQKEKAKRSSGGGGTSVVKKQSRRRTRSKTKTKVGYKKKYSSPYGKFGKK